MEIKKVISDKKEFLELLLLADEQESVELQYLIFEKSNKDENEKNS